VRQAWSKGEGVCSGNEECASSMGMGANHKRCISERCTNQAMRGGVCMRHGGKPQNPTMELPILWIRIS
jgi:hypothetical protein